MWNQELCTIMKFPKYKSYFLSIFLILRWFGNILENNDVTLSDELEVGYYITLFLIMHADDTALLTVCKNAEYIPGLYKKGSLLKIYLIASVPLITDYPLESVVKYKSRQ